MSNYNIIYEQYNNGSYYAVNGFKNNKRRKSNLKELLNFYIDLDVINTELFNEKYDEFKNDYDINKKFNEYYINEILNRCDEIGIPKPTKINYSGNGYHVYWNIKEYGKPDYFERFYGASHDLIKVYELIEKQLVKKFVDLGADNKATDSTRLLREEDTFNFKSNTFCETIYNTEKQIHFEDMNVLLKYSKEEVEQYKKITEKQKQFLISNNICTKNKIKSLDKFSAKKLIEDFIDDDREKRSKRATVKQLEYLNKYGVDINKYLTVSEADKLIKEIRLQNSPNYDYMYSMLNKIYTRNKVKEGNRALYYFYFAVACRRVDKSLDECISVATEQNKTIKLDYHEMIHHINSGFREEVSKNIKKQTILTDLGLSSKSIGKKIKRSNKSKIDTKYDEFKNNLSKYKSKSLRKVAEELKVSKSTVGNFIKKLKEEVKNRKDIKSKQIKEFILFLNDLFSQNEDKQTYNNEFIEEILKCPQNE